jgi:hypothetical protein
MGRYHPAETIISELRAAGIEPSEVRQAKKHFKIYFVLNGKSRHVVCANTPSDWRAARNNRSMVRRIIRQEKVQF